MNTKMSDAKMSDGMKAKLQDMSSTAKDMTSRVMGMNFDDWLGKDNTLGQSIMRRKYVRGDETFPEWLQRVSGGDEELARLIFEKKEGAEHGFKHYQHLTLIKKSSASVLKANQRISPATEHALVLYRNKLPKFNNTGEDGKRHMILDWMEFQRDGRDIPRIHPTQKPVNLLKRLISIFTDPGDTVIDVCAGSGSTLRAARELGRHSYGFEIDREFYAKARDEMLDISTDPSTTLTVPTTVGEKE